MICTRSRHSRVRAHLISIRNSLNLTPTYAGKGLKVSNVGHELEESRRCFSRSFSLRQAKLTKSGSIQRLRSHDAQDISVRLKDIDRRSSLSSLKTKSNKPSPTGLRLMDYINYPTTPPLLDNVEMASNIKKFKTFDIFNPKYVSGVIAKNHDKTIKSGLTADTLEAATIIAMRSRALGSKKDMEQVSMLSKRLSYYNDLEEELDDLDTFEPVSRNVSGSEPHVQQSKELTSKTLTDMSLDSVIPTINDISSNSNDYYMGSNGSESSSHSVIKTVLERHGYTLTDMNQWIKCIQAPSMTQSFASMESYQGKWPTFLIVFTLRRPCDSRMAAYKMMRLVEKYFGDMDSIAQSKVMIRSLRHIIQWIVELAPVLCRIFIDQAKSDLFTSFLMNQLLWQLCRFGAHSDSRTAMFLMQAQRSLVDTMSKLHISLDTKGYLALGFTLRVQSPERALSFLNIVKVHDYETSQQEQLALSQPTSGDYKMGKFPYTHAAICLEMMLCTDSTTLLNVFDKYINNSGSKSGTLWAILMDRLLSLSELTPEITEYLIKQIKVLKIQVSPLVLEKIMLGLNDSQRALELMSQFPRTRVNMSLAVTYLKICCNEDLNTARYFLSNLHRKPLRAYNIIIRAESLKDKENVWRTYKHILNSGLEPDNSTLKSLCMAASELNVLWQGLYAAQRTVVEFKHWVRGAHIDGSDARDYLKIYPSQALFHSYIRMLGRARYHDDLLEVLPWMERIGFVPDMKCLCALITYSPNGEYLFKHGRRAGGNWPNQMELNAYQSYRLNGDSLQN